MLFRAHGDMLEVIIVQLKTQLVLVFTISLVGL